MLDAVVEIKVTEQSSRTTLEIFKKISKEEILAAFGMENLRVEIVNYDEIMAAMDGRVLNLALVVVEAAKD